VHKGHRRATNPAHPFVHAIGPHSTSRCPLAVPVAWVVGLEGAQLNMHKFFLPCL
jgi:hypothetical protein